MRWLETNVDADPSFKTLEGQLPSFSDTRLLWNLFHKAKKEREIASKLQTSILWVLKYLSIIHTHNPTKKLTTIKNLKVVFKNTQSIGNSHRSFPQKSGFFFLKKDIPAHNPLSNPEGKIY